MVVTDSWSEDNRDVYFARPIARETKEPNKADQVFAGCFYCRLKNLTVGYDFPEIMVELRLHVAKGSVYFSAENLFEFTNVESTRP